MCLEVMQPMVTICSRVMEERRLERARGDVEFCACCSVCSADSFERSLILSSENSQEAVGRGKMPAAVN